MREFIEKDTVAELIGLESGEAFLRQRERLEREHDFPAPMPTCLRPLKWRAAAIEAWLDCQGLPLTEQAMLDPARCGPNVVLMSEAQKA